MRLVIAAAASLLLTVPLAATSVGEGPRTLQPRDLFGPGWAADPQVRPDGGAIATCAARRTS